MTLATWLCAGVTLVSALVSLGFSLAAVRAGQRDGRIAAEYALARSAALATVAGIAPFTGSVGFISAVAIAMIAVQGLDAIIGIRTRDRLKTFGPLATAAVNAAALVWLLAA